MEEKLLTYKKIQFSSKPIVLGVPNTVIFKYDVSNSNADSVFIQQSWDSERRFKVEKNLHEYTSTYYEPGYFKAKLILNDSIVKEHDLFIESNGWLGIIRRKPVPTYFSEQEIKKNGIIGINAADLLSKEVDLQKEQVPVLFYNVSKMNTVPGDSFHIEAEVRNTFNAGNGICQHSEIALFGTDGIILIPLSIKRLYL